MKGSIHVELAEQEKAQGGKDLGEGSEKTLGTRFTWWKCSRARGGVGVMP